MHYICLICSDPTLPHEPTGRLKLQPKHAEYEQTLRDRGVYAGGAGLMPPAQLPPVRINHKGAIITDGPFTETKEVIGGFYAIEAKDMDEAVKLASGIPIGPGDWIQIRQVALWHPL